MHPILSCNSNVSITLCGNIFDLPLSNNNSSTNLHLPEILQAPSLKLELSAKGTLNFKALTMCCLPDALAVKVSSVPSQTPASPDGIIHHHAWPETDLGKSKCYWFPLKFFTS